MSKQLKSQARNSYFYPRHNFLHHTFKQLPNKQHVSKKSARGDEPSVIPSSPPEPSTKGCKMQMSRSLMPDGACTEQTDVAVVNGRCRMPPENQAAAQLHTKRQWRTLCMVGLINIVEHVWGRQTSGANQLFEWASPCTCMSKEGQPTPPTNTLLLY